MKAILIDVNGFKKIIEIEKGTREIKIPSKRKKPQVYSYDIINESFVPNQEYVFYFDRIVEETDYITDEKEYISIFKEQYQTNNFD